MDTNLCNERALYLLMVLLNANNNVMTIPFEDFAKLSERNEPLRVIQKVDAEKNVQLVLEFCDCPKHRKEDFISDANN